MNILGIGVDIVEIDRMKAAVNKWGAHFLNKMFTEREIKYSNSKRFCHQHFAARFAAKEAVVKAFGGTNKFPIQWTDIEILNDNEGKPVVEFSGDAVKLKELKKIDQVMLTLSHSKHYAVANVMLLTKER
jgi:holo-[acyl-carrier protein] synthase